MKPQLTLILLCIFWTQNLSADIQDKDTKQIAHIIQSYGKAMSDSNIEGLMTLFAEDAIFIPSGHATAIGKKAVKAAYESELSIIDLDITVEIDEIFYHGDLAYARSRSLGQLTIRATGKKKSTQDYRAFFVLRKMNTEWKITRFLFNFASKD